MTVKFEFDTSKNIEKVKTSKGTYKVWSALWLVDFIPKGHRKAKETLHIDYYRGAEAPTQEDVYRTIIRLMAACESS